MPLKRFCDLAVAMTKGIERRVEDARIAVNSSSPDIGAMFQSEITSA